MSPRPEISGAPVGGLMRSSTAVSSRPAAMGLIVIWPPVSHVVRSVLPYTVAPVPYMNRLELKGSISIDSVIQPSFGLTSGGCGFAPRESQGERLTSILYRKLRLG